MYNVNLLRNIINLNSISTINIVPKWFYKEYWLKNPSKQDKRNSGRGRTPKKDAYIKKKVCICSLSLHTRRHSEVWGEELILLFSKDIINSSDVTAKTLIMLQTFLFLNLKSKEIAAKKCSFAITGLNCYFKL